MTIYERTRAETNAKALRVLHSHGEDRAIQIYRAWLQSAALHLTALVGKQAAYSEFHLAMFQILGKPEPTLIVNNADDAA